MVNNAERPGDLAETGIVARIVAILVAFGPPVAVSGWLWSKVQHNPVVSLVSVYDRPHRRWGHMGKETGIVAE
jgi:hypothetical protein